MSTQIVTFGPFRYDPEQGRLSHGDRPIPLRPRSRAVLDYLLHRPDQLISREELTQAIWRGGHVTPAALRVCIHDIRRALGDSAAAPRHLETVGRSGFRFRLVPAQHPADPPYHDAPRPVVGRQRELEKLHQHWTQAQQGQRRLVLLAGEAGAGKTTLIRAFLETLDPRGHHQILRGQCVEAYNRGEPFLPILEILRPLAHGVDVHGHRDLLRHQAPNWLRQLPDLHESTASAETGRLPAAGSRAGLWQEFASVMETLARQRPLLLVIEDLHWSDSASLDLLGYLLQRPAPARLLVIASFRPEAVNLEDSPLERLRHTLGHRGLGHGLTLAPLDHDAVSDYTRTRLAGEVDPALTALLLQRTGGHALFITDLLEFLLDSAQLLPGPRGWTLAAGVAHGDPARQSPGLAIPARTAQMITHQFSLLNDPQQRLLEVASAVGPVFAMAAVAAGLEMPLDEVELLGETLARRQRLIDEVDLTRWPDGTLSTVYRFRHDCHREAIYRQLAAGRRISIHRRIGAGLARAFADRPMHVAAELAYHFDEGQDPAWAVYYHRLGAELALHRHAPREAVLHCQQGLALVEQLEHPDPALTLALLLALINALSQHHGDSASTLLAPLQQAHRLSSQIATPHQRLRILWGFHSFYGLRGEALPERPYLRELAALARDSGDTAFQAVATHAVAGYWFFGHGRYHHATRAYERALALYPDDPQQRLGTLSSFDPRVVAHANRAWALAYSGRLDSTLHHGNQALALARRQQHPYSEALALIYAAKFRVIRGEVRAVTPLTGKLLAMCEEYGFESLLPGLEAYEGWAEIQRGHTASLARLRRSFETYRKQGMALLMQTVGTLLVDSLLALHHGAEALAVLDAQQAHPTACFEPEHLRQRGQLLALPGPGQRIDEAERLLQEALRLARRRRAGLFRLRAAMALARLWRDSERPVAAQALLASSYATLTEGHATPALQEARRLLDELSADTGISSLSPIP